MYRIFASCQRLAFCIASHEDGNDLCARIAAFAGNSQVTSALVAYRSRRVCEVSICCKLRTVSIRDNGYLNGDAAVLVLIQLISLYCAGDPAIDAVNGNLPADFTYGLGCVSPYALVARQIFGFDIETVLDVVLRPF